MGVLSRVSGTLGFGAARVMDSAMPIDLERDAADAGADWEGAAPERGRALALGTNLFLDLSARSQRTGQGRDNSTAGSPRHIAQDKTEDRGLTDN